MRHSFLQQVVLTVICAALAAGLVQFYRHMVYQANEDINGKKAIQENYVTGRNNQVPDPTRTK